MDEAKKKLNIKNMEHGGEVYRISEGFDHYKQRPLYQVNSGAENENEYVGEWHINRRDAEKELNQLNKGKSMERGGNVTAGELAKGYKQRPGIQVGQDLWDMWTLDQRLHFMNDHKSELETEPSVTVARNLWRSIPVDVKNSVQHHIREGQYASGGLVNGLDVDEILKHFLIAGLWASYDDNEENLDANYSISDVDENSKKQIVKGIRKFIHDNAGIIKKLGLNEESIGHDLFLDSQGHGVGFWDRNYIPEEDGKILSASASKIFPSDPPYVGDNGKVYFNTRNQKDLGGLLLAGAVGTAIGAGLGYGYRDSITKSKEDALAAAKKRTEAVRAKAEEQKQAFREKKERVKRGLIGRIERLEKGGLEPVDKEEVSKVIKKRVAGKKIAPAIRKRGAKAKLSEKVKKKRVNVKDKLGDEE